MLFPIRKIFFIFSFNLCLFLILMIGIQNSALKKRVNLLVNSTVKLPVSFIIGISFISGSVTGSLLRLNSRNKG